MLDKIMFVLYNPIIIIKIVLKYNFIYNLNSKDNRVKETETRMAYTSLVKKINEQSIIGCMRDGNVHTKQEIARLTKLSFPTVGKIVEELVARKMLVRIGIQEESFGGRKADIYKIHEDFVHMLLLYLQGQSISYWICDALGTVKSSHVKEGEKGQSPFSLIQECVTDMVAADDRIGAIAVGLPGSIYGGKVCRMDGYTDMNGRDVESALAEIAKIPVSVSNNMNLVAMGIAAGKTRLAGGAFPQETTVCIHLADTGPGLGAVVNGKPLYGFSGFQGEVGFMPLCGEKNIQDVAMGGFREAPAGECLGKMIACVCTVLNPSQVICYLEWEQEGLAEEVSHCCRKYLPAYAQPQFIFDRDYKRDYLHGLVTAGEQLLFQ